jgi:hypothetical protein
MMSIFILDGFVWGWCDVDLITCGEFLLVVGPVEAARWHFVREVWRLSS